MANENFFIRLIAALPNLRNHFTLTGLVVTVAGFIATRVVAPEQIQAQISAGAIGVIVLVFGQLFHHLGKFSEKDRFNLIIILFVIFSLLVLLLIGLTLIPFILSRPPDVATIRIMVLGPDKMPVEKSEISSSIGGETKKVGNGWELEVAESKLPNDRKITIYAEQKQARLKGRLEVHVVAGKITQASIPLQRDASAQVKGSVSDETGRPVADADVNILGSAESITTNFQGFFTLPTNRAEGEEVRLRVTKDGYEPLEQYHPAGNNPAYLVLRRTP